VLRTAGDDSNVTDIPDLPDVPFFLEPNTHVYVGGLLPSGAPSLDMVVQLVEDVFNMCQVDFVFKPQKCKVRRRRSRPHPWPCAMT
jgi:hypothetical protein